MTEPSPIRDIGPYQDPEQVLAQFNAWSHGMPGGTTLLCYIAIREAALLAKIELTSFEEGELRSICGSMTFSEAQIIASMIIRAHLAGRERLQGS